MKINFVQYEPNSVGAPNGLVAYVVSDRVVVYSGLITFTTTTINAAEAVVIAICEREKLDWRNCVFIDMQTRRGYPRMRKYDRQLSRLVFDDTSTAPSVKGFGPADDSILPAGSVELFDELPWYEDTPSTKLEDISQ